MACGFLQLGSYCYLAVLAVLLSYIDISWKHFHDKIHCTHRTTDPQKNAAAFTRWFFTSVCPSVWLVVWLGGNALALINVVALRQTRLVPGWMTVCWTGKPSRCVTSQLSKLSLSSLRGRYASTNLPGWGEGGAITSVGWQITLCDPIDKWRPVVTRWISLTTIRSFTFLPLVTFWLTVCYYHSCCCCCCCSK